MRYCALSVLKPAIPTFHNENLTKEQKSSRCCVDTALKVEKIIANTFKLNKVKQNSNTFILNSVMKCRLSLKPRL